MPSIFPQVIEGVVGELRWNYYRAAEITGYRVTWSSSERRWSLAATVVLADAFKIAQRPLRFVARVRDAEWEWDMDTIEFTGLRGPLTATLSAPRSRRR
jgi:hypothetical protein